MHCPHPQELSVMCVCVCVCVLLFKMPLFSGVCFARGDSSSEEEKATLHITIVSSVFIAGN